ncbi:hypothetical protein D3C87_1805710 [compost metagenome]
MAESTDTAVHHIARRNEIGTGSGMTQAHACKGFYRCIIKNDAFFRVYDAIMSVDRIRVQCNIGHDNHIRYCIFYRLNGCLHQPVRVPAFLTGIIFQLIITFDKQQNRFDAHVPYLFYFINGFVQ